MATLPKKVNHVKTSFIICIAAWPYVHCNCASNGAGV